MAKSLVSCFFDSRCSYNSFCFTDETLPHFVAILLLKYMVCFKIADLHLPALSCMMGTMILAASESAVRSFCIKALL